MVRDVRHTIVKTATCLFYEHGTASVGVDRIIHESGVAKATFYRHFPSKDDLVAAVLDHHHEEALQTLPASASAIADRRGISPVLALFDALKRWFALPEFNGCAFVRTVLERPGDERSRQIAADHKRALEAWIASTLIGEGWPDADAQATAAAIIIVYDGAIVQARLRRDPAIADTARAIVERLLGSAKTPAPQGPVR